MKAIASVVSLLLFVTFVISALILGVYLWRGYVEITEASLTNQDIYTLVSQDPFTIDSLFWDGNTLTIRATFLLETGELNLTNLFINGVYEGNCQQLQCADQTGNGYLVKGESVEINIPYSGGCEVKITLEYSGSNVTTYTNLCVWRCRVPIDITATFDYNNYSVRIDLNSDNFNFAGASSDGSDIRFYDGTVKLDYWIENWDSIGGSATVWVETNVINGTKRIYMYYCNPVAISESNGYSTFIYFDFNDVNLVAVFHFNEGTGTTSTDATGNYTADLNGATWTSGRFGSGILFDGNDDCVRTTFNSEFNEFTYFVWSFASTTQSNNPAHIISDGAFNRTLGIGLGGTNPYIHFDTDTLGYVYSSSDIGGAWYALTVMVSGPLQLQQLYINGLLDINDTITSLPTRLWALNLGNENCSGNYDYNGILDELIIFGRLLTPEEINAIWKGYFDNLSGFWVVRSRVDPEPSVVIGPEETGEWYLN